MFGETGKLNPQKYSLIALLPYLRKYRGRILLGALMVLLTNLAVVTLPKVLGRAIDHLSGNTATSSDLFFFAALILALGVIEGFFRFWMRRVLIGVSRYIEYDLRNDLFRHLQRLTPRFYQEHSTGDVMSRSTNDLSAVRMVLGPGIMYSFNTISMTVLTIGILLQIDARLACLSLIPLLLVSYSATYFGRKIHQRFEKIQEQFSTITTLAQENVSGIRVVKAYGQERASVRRFQEANQEYVKRSLALVRIWGVFYPLLTFLLGLSGMCLLWYGGRRVVSGSISIGELVAFMVYVTRLTWPTIALGWVINVVERGSASMSRINRILAQEPDVRDEATVAVEKLKGKLEVRNLSFSYGEINVFKDLSFKVDPGQTVAIVGSTGSGKSTLVHLLCRLYPVPRETVFIDDIDINDLPLQKLRSRIGCVPQDSFLFSETIGQNISFGRPDADLERVRLAAWTSNILDDIEELPEQMSTFVGERGITLSGGQKQRVAISRALLLEPDILVLDDSLSSVDTHTEERILERLSQELSNRTSILISHRISTVQKSDLILVFEDGQIIERGTHTELLGTGGPYAELHQKQLLREELESE